MKIAIKTNKTADITDLIPKFVVFFDASIPTTITRDANNKISGWLDRSLNQFHATQTTLTYQPTYTSFNSFFGINCTSLSGVNNSFLQFTINADFPAINGILYVATDKYVLPLPINISSSSSNRTFEITGGTSNLLTGLILFQGEPNEDEDSRIVSYLSIKGSNSLTLTNVIMDFCVETSSSLYLNPLMAQVNNLSSWNQINTSNVISFNQAWRKITKPTTFPIIDTSTATSIQQAWLGMTGLTSFPILNFGNVQTARSAWLGNAGLTSFPFVALSKATDISFSWSGCSNLTLFPAMDFRAATAFENTWRNCKLNQESVDNILISIAAGLANNPTKILAANGGSFTLTGGTNAAPGTTNRRSSWGANVWEFNLSQINENISGTIYDFRSGITGQQAKNWLAAKGWAIATN
jgi:hypothetical protein